MEHLTKAVFNLKEGILELEGSEAFVAKYLDEFKSHFDVNYKKDNKVPSPETSEPQAREVKVSKKDKTGTATKAKAKKVKDFSPIMFDIYPKGKTSLEDFLKEKNPGDTAKERILVVAYYIKNTLGLPSFTEGNIEYVYRTLKLSKKPIHLRQILTNIKNNDSQLEQVDDGWFINRVGEKFVDEQLPKKVSPLS